MSTVPPFDLSLPPRIAFGPGRAEDLPVIVAGLGTRVLVATGSTPGRVAHLIDGVRARVDVVDVVPVPGEPSLEDARRATSAGRDLGADVVLAIGGGSVIDLAKAAAMLLGNGGDPLDYLEVIGRGQPITRAPLPLVAVPTTAGTGAEVTSNAVLSSSAHGVKASLRHPLMIPRHAVVDPELTLNCPPDVTAASGMDALTQCLEPYVSNRANPITDALAGRGLAAAGQGLRRAHDYGSDVAARTDMALASVLGGLSLANAKLGAVHGFAAVLGGMSDAPHGAICAALLAPVCRANIARADASLARRYADVAKWLTGDPGARAADGLAWIEHTVSLLGIRRLSDYGLSAAQTDEVVAKAARASSMQGNPVVLTPGELADTYLAAL